MSLNQNTPVTKYYTFDEILELLYSTLPNIVHISDFLKSTCVSTYEFNDGNSLLYYCLQNKQVLQIAYDVNTHTYSHKIMSEKEFIKCTFIHQLDGEKKILRDLYVDNLPDYVLSADCSLKEFIIRAFSGNIMQQQYTETFIKIYIKLYGETVEFTWSEDDDILNAYDPLNMGNQLYVIENILNAVVDGIIQSNSNGT
jgi:hypothetical protein